ncbi:MAG: hypothetical protein WBV31_07355 [Terriglobales bacterium]
MDYIKGAWSEGTIDASNAPPSKTPIATGIALTPADKYQYKLVNIRSEVQAWLNGSVPTEAYPTMGSRSSVAVW